MMVRTQISLDSEIHAQTRKRAATLGISLAEYIRRLVEQDLTKSARTVDRSIIFDLGGSKDTDIASEKDRMIGEAIVAGKRQRSDTVAVAETHSKC